MDAIQTITEGGTDAGKTTFIPVGTVIMPHDVGHPVEGYQLLELPDGRHVNVTDRTSHYIDSETMTAQDVQDYMGGVSSKQVHQISEGGNRRERRKAAANARKREVCGRIISERLLPDGTLEQRHATKGIRIYRKV